MDTLITSVTPPHTACPTLYTTQIDYNTDISITSVMPNTATLPHSQPCLVHYTTHIDYNVGTPIISVTSPHTACRAGCVASSSV